MTLPQILCRAIEIMVVLYVVRRTQLWFKKTPLRRPVKFEPRAFPKGSIFQKTSSELTLDPKDRLLNAKKGFSPRHPQKRRIVMKGKFMGGIIILSNAAEKIRAFNENPNDRPRESFHQVLTARKGSMSFVDHEGNVGKNHVKLIDWALRSYFIMNKGNKMGTKEEFIERLGTKLQKEEIRNILVKFREISITIPEIEDYKSDAKKLYDSFSNPNGGLSRDGTHFCVGATKVMHCLFPELFIILDRNVAKTIRRTTRSFGSNHNNFVSYWQTMRVCIKELKEWKEENGDFDSLPKLDVGFGPTTLTRIFDKCAFIMAIQANN